MHKHEQKVISYLVGNANFGSIVGENPDCLLLSRTVVGENPDHVCWALSPFVAQKGCNRESPGVDNPSKANPVLNRL